MFSFHLLGERATQLHFLKQYGGLLHALKQSCDWEAHSISCSVVSSFPRLSCRVLCSTSLMQGPDNNPPHLRSQHLQPPKILPSSHMVMFLLVPCPSIQDMVRGFRVSWCNRLVLRAVWFLSGAVKEYLSLGAVSNSSFHSFVTSGFGVVLAC